MAIGDLSDVGQIRGVADQVNRLGPIDAVIHKAGVISGLQVLPVNVVAVWLAWSIVTYPPPTARPPSAT
jgi:hypothetical protein